jgi:hypothetical protein
MSTLEQLRDVDGINITLDGRLAEVRSRDVATWHGGAQKKSYPRYYAEKRIRWQTRIREEDWTEAEKVLREEYNWKKRDWYNVGKLTGMYASGLSRRRSMTLMPAMCLQQRFANTIPPEEHGEELVNDNLTLLHILAIKPPPPCEETEKYESWERLVDGASQPEVWSKSNDVSSLAAALTVSNEYAIETVKSFDSARNTAYDLAKKH